MCLFGQVWELRNTKEQKEKEDQEAAAGDAAESDRFLHRDGYRAAIMSVAWSRCEHVFLSEACVWGDQIACLDGKRQTNACGCVCV
jgi:hypothetical protein